MLALQIQHLGVIVGVPVLCDESTGSPVRDGITIRSTSLQLLSVCDQGIQQQRRQSNSGNDFEGFFHSQIRRFAHRVQLLWKANIASKEANNITMLFRLRRNDALDES